MADFLPRNPLSFFWAQFHFLPHSPLSSTPTPMRMFNKKGKKSLWSLHTFVALHLALPLAFVFTTFRWSNRSTQHMGMFLVTSHHEITPAQSSSQLSHYYQCSPCFPRHLLLIWLHHARGACIGPARNHRVRKNCKLMSQWSRHSLTSVNLQYRPSPLSSFLFGAAAVLRKSAEDVSVFRCRPAGASPSQALAWCRPRIRRRSRGTLSCRSWFRSGRTHGVLRGRGGCCAPTPCTRCWSARRQLVARRRWPPEGWGIPCSSCRGRSMREILA